MHDLIRVSLKRGGCSYVDAFCTLWAVLRTVCLRSAAAVNALGLGWCWRRSAVIPKSLCGRRFAVRRSPLGPTVASKEIQNGGLPSPIFYPLSFTRFHSDNPQPSLQFRSVGLTAFTAKVVKCTCFAGTPHQLAPQGKLTFSSTHPSAWENSRFLLGWMGLERLDWVEGTWALRSGTARESHAASRCCEALPDTLKCEQRATSSRSRRADIRVNSCPFVVQKSFARLRPDRCPCEA